MTVAAFMVAAASYAATTPTNKGVEVKVAKDAATGEVTLTLQKGTYEIKSDKGSTVAVDGDATFAGTLAVDAKKDYKITVTLPAAATEEVKVILTVTPTTPEWKTWLEKQQNAINALTTEASALGQINETDLGWRTGYLERVSTLQGDKNKFGIDEYNEWLEKGTVEALSGLSALEVEIHDATKNHTAYLDALKAYTEAKKSGSELDVSKMTSVYNGLSDKSAYTETYNSIKKEIDGLEDNAKKSYLERNAASNYDATKLAAEISGLKGRIDALTKAMQSGSTQLKNYADVLNRVEAAIANYNKVANDLYSQLVASTIPVGYGADIYTDKYQAAMKSLNEVLAKIYDVKKVNDAAKEAYDAETDINKKPEIPALPSTWAADDYETELKAVYSKVIAEVGTKVNPATGTLRAAYKVLATQISDLRKSLNDFKDAKKDEDTDKNGKVIGTWFTGKVSEIEGKIGALETDINNANKAHTVLSFDINAKGKSEIDSRKTELDARLTEYNKYVVSRNSISTLEKSTYKTAKDKVNTYKYKAYVAAERFSMAPINKAIAEVTADARKNYQVDANDYTYGGTVTSTISTITGKINAWEASAKNAHDKYKEIYDDIAGYDLQIKGRKAEKDKDGNETVKEILSWDSVVTNENVVVGGAASGTTYGQAKSAQDLIKTGALDELNKAMAVDKAKEDDFVKQLGVAHAKHTNVEDATEEIIKLKDSFSEDEPKWQQETNYQAAVDAIAESKRIVDVYKTNLNAITGYDANSCGIAAAKKLDEDKVNLGADIKKIEGLIKEVENSIPATSTGFNKEIAATAIAQINEIRDASAKVKTGIDKLNNAVDDAKENFKEVNDALTEIGYRINGREAAENVEKIASIEELLSPSMVDFTTEINDLKDIRKAILDDLNAAPVVADARKDTPKTDTTPLVKGLNTRVKELGIAVDDIREKATNEAKNQTNMNAWESFLKNPNEKKNPTADDAAQAIINKVIADIKKTNPDVAESAGENYFLGLVGDATKGQQKAYNDILTEATSAYGKKLKDSKYTDPANNLTDAKLVELEKQVKALLDKIANYPSRSKTNEEAKAAQDKKWNDLSTKYEAIRVEISASTPSGENFEEAYKDALKTLTEINNDLENYATDKEIKYGKGESEKFDPKLTLPQLTKIESVLKSLETWNQDSYVKAVAADNEARYNAFLTAANTLKKTYYGETVGTTHTDGAIDLVTKLSKLSYANQVKPEDFETLVSGADGLYAYANKIEELMARAEKSYKETDAPDFFDFSQSLKTEATDMEKTIVAKRDAYAAEVNNEAKKTYEDRIKAVEKSIKEVCEAVIRADLAADEAKAKELLNEKKSDKPAVIGKGAITIYEEAVESYNDGTPVVDFAYRLDNEFLPGFEVIDDLLSASKDLAAQDAWTKKLANVNTAADRKAMETFYWSAQWKYELLENFVPGGALEVYESFEFESLPTSVTFDEYADMVDFYNQFVKTRTIEGKDETHTLEYWEAYDSDVQYKKLKAAAEELNTEIARLNGVYGIAESGIRDLVIEHDELLVSNLETIKKDIENLATVKNTIEKDIDALNSIAIYKELQALNIEMNNMKKYLETNGSKDTETWKNVDALQQENAKIYSLFNAGEGTPAVKATAEVTYASYRKLEKQIGALKTSFDTTVANDKAVVDKAFAELKDTQAKFDALYDGMFKQTKDEYEDDYKAIAPQIDAIKDKIDAQTTAISIEKANNIKSIEKATKAIDDLTAELKAYNKDYEDNAQFVDEQKALLKQYKSELDKVVTDGKALKNVKTTIDNKHYVDIRSEYINVLSENAVVALDKLEDYVKSAYYNTLKDDAENQVNSVESRITELEKQVLTYDVNTEANNVADRITDVETKIEETIPTTAALYKELNDLIDAQCTARQEADTYKENVLNGGYWLNNEWQSLNIVDNHDEVMDNYQTILDALEEIKSKIKRPGAIKNDGGEVIAEDLAEMVKLALRDSWTDEELTLADVDGNKAVDVADLVMVRNFFLYGKYDGLASATTTSANKVAARTPQTAGTMALAVQKASLGVSLDSEINYSAVQMDVTLPAGLILTDATFAGAGEVNAEFNKIGDHTWRVVVYAADGESVNVNADLVKLGMAGAGNGQIVIDNVKGANARGMLISIKGVAGDYSGATGINATMAQAKAYFYGVDGTVRKGISKGITIVKEAGNKVKKVLTK